MKMQRCRALEAVREPLSLLHREGSDAAAAAAAAA
jgi:hypothetical protein